MKIKKKIQWAAKRVQMYDVKIFLLIQFLFTFKTALKRKEAKDWLLERVNKFYGRLNSTIL